jgi:nucleoside 2-deoxyribosyltransferase
MNIYFSCPITGGRDYQPIFEIMVEHLLSREHEVPTEHLARPEVLSLESVADPEEVYQRDISWIKECDAVIAEVSIPSHGVGYEIAYALSIDKPVLCCSRRGVPVSKMITGNDSPSLVVRTYEENDEVMELIDMFLSDVRDILAES